MKCSKWRVRLRFGFSGVMLTLMGCFPAACKERPSPSRTASCPRTEVDPVIEDSAGIVEGRLIFTYETGCGKGVLVFRKERGETHVSWYGRDWKAETLWDGSGFGVGARIPASLAEKFWRGVEAARPLLLTTVKTEQYSLRSVLLLSIELDGQEHEAIITVPHGTMALGIRMEALPDSWRPLYSVIASMTELLRQDMQAYALKTTFGISAPNPQQQTFEFTNAGGRVEDEE